MALSPPFTQLMHLLAASLPGARSGPAGAPALPADPYPPSVCRRLQAPGDPLPTYPNERGAAYPTRPLTQSQLVSLPATLVQAVSPMNRLASCARGSLKNVLSEVRDPRNSLRDSMDHVTGACFRPKSKPGWSWWYSPREFDPKKAPQATKHMIFEFLDPKLP